MIYRKYGSTNIDVSAIGFGGMRFPNQDDVEQASTLVRAAYDAGINYFDTAIHYGKSEELFGAAFKEMKKTRTQKPFYVSSKTFAADESSVRQELETSLTRMGLDYIDFYHVWCLITPQAWKERQAGGVIKAFEKIKAEGLIKHIVVSTHMTGDDTAAMLNDYPFDGVLLGYSAMNFAYREAGIAAAAAKNMGVVVMNPLGGGIIPQNPERFDFVKTQKDETVVEGALRFLINDPRITVVLVGLSTLEQLSETTKAVDGYKPIPASALEKIRANVKSAFNQMCTGCQYCDGCPENIPIPKLMDAYNHYMLGGKTANLVDRLQWHWSITAPDGYWKKCVACGKCETECTQQLPIINRLKEMSELIDAHLAAQPKQ